ncbi:uncharacterized protein LOC142226487 [Haematobia irritans]|uniref:uncharacterized protein LOC142226487 n=1 Tax=Haematobia irritans TaxID=7368 RepID=UPI003F50AF66
MFNQKAAKVLLVSVIFLLGQFSLCQGYTQVSTSGSGHSGEGPKIYKALNLDLVFPKSFNSSDNVISTTPFGLLDTISKGSLATDVNRGIEGEQHNPMLEQSNESGQLLYITPSPNEAAILYQQTQDTNSNDNTHGKHNYAQVVTQNPINIQRQEQSQENDNGHNSAAKEQQNTATGRAVDYQTGYPFGQLITPLIKNAPRPVYSVSNKAKPSNVGKIYPQAVYQRKPPSQAEIDKLRGRGAIRDRFTPSEAVASHQIKANHDHHQHHNHAPTYTTSGKIPAASNVVNTYVPPKNLYSFPPNNVDYPLPTQDNKAAMPTSIVNSYSPLPSGLFKDGSFSLDTASSNDDGYKYTGPLNLGYLPSINNDNGGSDTKDHENADSGDADNGDDSIGVLPASAMGNDNTAGSMDMDAMDQMSMKDTHSNDDHAYDTEKEYPTPPPEWLKAHPEALHDHPPHDETMDDHPLQNDNHDHHTDDQDHDHHGHPDIIVDSDTYPYHHHSFPSYPIYPHYPEIIYDDHHHHHHVEPPPPTTTEPPPPEPPPEPRVKKYSYFYIGRKLWYIPLYFTVWFSFYVLWLILKSIARHKVNLPNHYVSRRSVDNYNLSNNHKEIINQLTLSVMEKIEQFQRKHLS